MQSQRFFQQATRPYRPAMPSQLVQQRLRPMSSMHPKRAVYLAFEKVVQIGL
jgi:hypothetical protein